MLVISLVTTFEPQRGHLMHWIKWALCLYLSWGLINSNAVAQQIFQGQDTRPSGTASSSPVEEFSANALQGEILMTINVLGAVNKAGIYRVPKQTDIVRLLAFAGGPKSDADLNKIRIKRRSQEHEQVIEVDLEAILAKTGVQAPILEADDIVLVSAKEPWISQNSLTLVGFLASILSLIVSGIVLSKHKS